MGSRRSWAARQIERGRFLGSGSYGLIHTIAAAGERPGLVRDVRDRDGDGDVRDRHGDGDRPGAPGGVPPLGPPEAEVPYQHRTEWEPGRRRGEEAGRGRLTKGR